VAARGTTFAKQDRERAKKAKAAQKQERRAAREAELAEQPTELPAEGDVPAETLLRLVQELHDGFADGRMSFEDFEKAKTELMERIAAVS
jgi:hypothetical protein